ncbi:MAG: hypothetical protein HYX97_07010 [Chloroflexi bacterium]|nr:hypothetical protein [Chloroflexota bacterium]
MKELTEAIAGYLDYVQTNLAAHLGRGPDRGYLSAKVHPSPAAAKDWFETLEEHPTWNKPAETCAQLFGKERHGEKKWKGRTGSWMRRRGTYLSLLDGVCPNPAEVADALVRDVETTEDRIVLLAPLEGVGFAKTEMDFGDFQILQPKADQLESVLGIRANRIFYPYAARSTKRLTDHWYIHCENKEKRTLGWTYSLDDLFFGGGPVQAEYTHLPPRIELFLKNIILWDEQEHGLGDDYWMPFVSIPFVIEASDNPFKGPRPAPPIAEFRTYQPVCGFRSIVNARITPS